VGSPCTWVLVTKVEERKSLASRSPGPTVFDSDTQHRTLSYSIDGTGQLSDSIPCGAESLFPGAHNVWYDPRRGAARAPFQTAQPLSFGLACGHTFVHPNKYRLTRSIALEAEQAV